MFKCSLQLWCCCFFVHYSSSGTECFTVLRWERDGVPCEGIYPNAQANLRAGRRAFCRSGLCIFPNERCVSGERSACFSFLSRLFFGVRCTYGYHVSSERCSQPAAYDQHWQQTCMNELISSPFALCVCFERRSEVHKPPCALRSLSPLCQFNSETIASARFSTTTTLSPSMSRHGDRRRKPFGKETTAIPAQICSVWRRLAFHIDSGGLSTVPPTLLRPLIG